MSVPWIQTQHPGTFVGRRWWDPSPPVVDTTIWKRWGDASALHSLNFLGWWDGTQINPTNILGFWDGATIQPLKTGA